MFTHRKIIHIDMDAFYASIEQRDHPEYNGKPLAVGHGKARGVVAAASYEARKYGIRSAMPSLKALQLYPELIFVPGRMDVYKEESKKIRQIFHRYTDIIEPLSLDEAFLDVTINKTEEPLAINIARQIRLDIKNELNLTASAGISYNKFLAKIASDYRKPNGMCTIHPDKALDFIAGLPIELFWGVGQATAKRMHSLGITNGNELRQQKPEDLIRHFGKMGILYYNFSRGIDERPVEPLRVRKSVGCEQTFHDDIHRAEAMEHQLVEVAEELVRRISRAAFQGMTLTLKLKFPDFSQKTRCVTQPAVLSDLDDILPLAQTLLGEIETNDQPFRLLGLSVSNSPSEQDPGDWEQLWFNFE